MKTTKLLFALLSLSLIIYACGSDDDNGPSYINKLTGGNQKVWVISSSSQNGIEKCVSTCLKENYAFVFKKSGTVIFPTYNCSNAPCGSGSSSEDGGEIPFTLSNHGKLLSFDTLHIPLTKLTETELIIGDLSGTSNEIFITFIPK